MIYEVSGSIFNEQAYQVMVISAGQVNLNDELSMKLSFTDK